MKNESRKILLYLTILHKGNWDKIYQDIIKKQNLDNEEEIERTFNKFKGHFITIIDKEYPNELKQVHKPPFVLFYEGNIDLLRNTDLPKIAIGNSNEDKYYESKIEKVLKGQKRFVYIIGGESKTDDLIIYSQSALNPIIAVIGYPLEHYSNSTKQRLVNSNGLVISEYPESAYMELTNEHFLSRYRIMSGLCDSTLIMSSSKKSGSLLLTLQTLELGKQVMVIPTDINEESENNKLIYEGAIPVYDNTTLCDTMN